LRGKVFEDAPVLCGHRGSGRGVVRGLRENTLDSFRAAVRAGLRYVEVDARLTADGVLVARHDPRLEDGRWIAGLPAAETGLMRVADLLEDLPAEIGIDIEVKSAIEDALRPRDQTTAARVAGLAATRAGVLVTSFDASVLGIVRERAPAVPVGLLTWRRFPLRKAVPAAVHLGAQVLAPEVESFGLRGAGSPNERPIAETVRIAHEAGLELAAWCPAPSEREPLIAAGVDCLIVDDVLP
jgi:glycerophosphoryl diester phosphodiesterase